MLPLTPPGGGAGGYGGTLTAKEARVGKGTEDVGDNEGGESGKVPDRLHPGYLPQSLQERGRPGPPPQFGSLHGDGTTRGRDGAGTRQVHRGTKEDSTEATEAADAGGRTLRGSTTGCAETATAGAASERVDL